MKSIEFIFDNVLLKGLVLERDRFFIKVQLISPFEAWENYSIISGMCRATPNHFLTEQGDITIRQLLIDSYQKFKKLYDSLDRISNVYINLQLELKSLNEISDIEIRNKIRCKLEDWFFDGIFTSSVTGIIASYNDRSYIFEIIENHLKQNENKKNEKIMGKKIVFIDMDGVLVDFKDAIENCYKNNPHYKEKYKTNPDEIPNIFKNPKPIEGAIEAVNKLADSGKFELFIATSATWNNHESATHKRLWIEKYFGDLFKKKMFITHRKDLLLGDYLIDDREANGANGFNGELLPFGWAYEKNKWNEYRTWEEILNKLLI